MRIFQSFDLFVRLLRQKYNYGFLYTHTHTRFEDHIVSTDPQKYIIRKRKKIGVPILLDSAGKTLDDYENWKHAQTETHPASFHGEVDLILHIAYTAHMQERPTFQSDFKLHVKNIK